jgi:hypothetical protein
VEKVVDGLSLGDAAVWTIPRVVIEAVHVVTNSSSRSFGGRYGRIHLVRVRKRPSFSLGLDEIKRQPHVIREHVEIDRRSLWPSRLEEFECVTSEQADSDPDPLGLVGVWYVVVSKVGAERDYPLEQLGLVREVGV